MAMPGATALYNTLYIYALAIPSDQGPVFCSMLQAQACLFAGPHAAGGALLWTSRIKCTVDKAERCLQQPTSSGIPEEFRDSRNVRAENNTVGVQPKKLP